MEVGEDQDYNIRPLYRTDFPLIDVSSIVGRLPTSTRRTMRVGLRPFVELLKQGIQSADPYIQRSAYRLYAQALTILYKKEYDEDAIRYYPIVAFDNDSYIYVSIVHPIFRDIGIPYVPISDVFFQNILDISNGNITEDEEVYIATTDELKNSIDTLFDIYSKENRFRIAQYLQEKVIDPNGIRLAQQRKANTLDRISTLADLRVLEDVFVQEWNIDYVGDARTQMELNRARQNLKQHLSERSVYAPSLFRSRFLPPGKDDDKFDIRNRNRGELGGLPNRAIRERGGGCYEGIALKNGGPCVVPEVEVFLNNNTTVFGNIVAYRENSIFIWNGIREIEYEFAKSEDDLGISGNGLPKALYVVCNRSCGPLNLKDVINQPVRRGRGNLDLQNRRKLKWIKNDRRSALAARFGNRDGYWICTQ